MLYDDAFLSRLEGGLREKLPSWGLDEASPLRLLTISENATYLAEDEARGRKVVFRVHRPAYHSEAEIRSELAWTEALRADGVVDTPHLVPALDGTQLCSFVDGGQTRFVAAFEFMSGREPDTTDDLVKWYGRLGAINATLHHHSRAWTRPAGFTRKIWDTATTIGPDAYWGDWRDGLGLTEDGRAVLARTGALLERQIAGYGRTSENFGLIHADMRPANLLVDGERLGVIDFDDCGESWFMFDFAAAVSFQESESYIPDLMAAWVENYRRVAPLSAADEAMLPVFVMLRRMHLTAWIASHAETPTAQSMGEPYTAATVDLADSYLSTHA
ncbi:phosphotransferase enzyme family protein [Terrihabitans rhizophilus]|uniref:Phosphotransferase n=1 Tax=Terrihabitans rhizophilus TaxID=3092662 RepID=A0ABU4RMC9_9HYPH|nr:phosphotransferase [Terrihabitans sp. PJ23]MDX6805988.1 phosphotransferase [Terrihabitans sp. PJ23]